MDNVSSCSAILGPASRARVTFGDEGGGNGVQMASLTSMRC